MRHVALNKHRVRYWLSVGAEPTRRVQRLLEKFDFVPKAYAPFGSQHQYQKPEKVYGLMAFRGIAKNGGAADQRVE
jgi:ribosomal protein S16